MLSSLLLAIAVGGTPVTAPKTAAMSVRRFDQNAGQWSGDVRFVARTPHGTLALGAADARVRLRAADGRSAAIGLRWDAAAGTIEGVERLPGLSHYLIGSDGDRWRSGVPGFRRVRYAGVAPNVDLEFYGAADGFEYDLVVGPGGNPDTVSLRFDGVPAAHVDADGSVVLETSAGTFRQHAPIAFQERDGVRTAVDVRYDLQDGRIRFRTGAYDRSRPLVIDPTFDFSTYFGGGGDETIRAVKTDAAGNIYVAGYTTSPDLPMGVFQSMVDAFVAKFTPDGSTLVYCTILGGTGIDKAYGLGVTPGGAAYVAGFTDSADLPVTAGAFQSTNSLSGGFLARLSNDGSSLVFSTYLGGSGDDRIEGLAVDALGAAYVTGPTQSADFPLLNAFRTAPGGSFVAKFTSAGSPVYSTYFGGSGVFGLIVPTSTPFRVNLHAIAVDGAGAAYVGGDALSTSLTPPALEATAGAYRTTPGDGLCTSPVSFDETYPCLDGVVAKLTPSGTLAYATYLRGDNERTDARTPFESVSGIAVDPQGNAVVVGTTGSATFPTTPGATRSACAAPRCSAIQVFVTKLNALGSGLVFSSLLGGTGGSLSGTGDIGPASFFGSGTPSTGIAVDALGQTIVTGWTTSPDLPVMGAQQTVLASNSIFALTGDGLVATPINPPNARPVVALAVAFNGTRYVFDQTESTPLKMTLSRSVDYGATWTILAPPSGASPVTVDPNSSQTIYTFADKSTDQGNTWTPMGTQLAAPPVVRVGSPNVLFGLGFNTAGGKNVLKSVDGGATWALSSSGIAPGAFLTGIAIAQSDANVMWTWGGSWLYQSIDGGASWSSRTPPDQSLGTLLISLVQVNELYLTGLSGIWKTTNAGASWTKRQSLSFGGPMISLSPTTLIASGYMTTYRSTDYGDSWTLVQPIRATQFANNYTVPGAVFAVAWPLKDAFVATLSWTGSLVYESYLGGLHDDIGYGVAAAPNGDVIVGGSTQSTTFPTRNAYRSANAGGVDGFVTKLRYPQVFFSIDTPSDHATALMPITLSGWAVDHGSAADSGIDSVHIWAISSTGVPTFIAAAPTNLPRADVAALLGPQFAHAGYQALVSGLAPDTYTFTVTPHSSVTNTFAPSKLLTVTIPNLGLAFIDAPASGSTTFGGARLEGWAIDRAVASGAGTGITAVHVYAFPQAGVSPIFLGVATLGVPRPDIAALFGSQFANAGFSLTLPPLTPGVYTFVAAPFSSVGNAFLTPATVVAQAGPSQPAGSLDVPAHNSTVNGTFMVGGWAIDRSAPAGTGIDYVHVYAFQNGTPTFLGVATLGVPRSDIGTIFGSQFTNAGYSLTVTGLAPGTYDLYTFAHSTVTGQNIVRANRITVQ